MLVQLFFITIKKCSLVSHFAMKTVLQVIIFVFSFTNSRHSVDWMLKTGVSFKVRYSNLFFPVFFFKDK